MKITHASARGFSRALETVWNIIDEGVFKISEEGVELMAMDPSQISMVVFRMDKNAFFEYELEKELNIGLDMAMLRKILKRAKNPEMITLGVEGNYLTVTFHTEKSQRTFKFAMLDLTQSITREPAIEYNNYVKLEGGAFKEAIKDIETISDYVEIRITPDNLELLSESDNAKIHEKFELGGDVLFELKHENSPRALFSVEYLSDMLKPIKKGDMITLYVETNKPLKMTTSLEGAEIKYYLAPRIQES